SVAAPEHQGAAESDSQGAWSGDDTIVGQCRGQLEAASERAQMDSPLGIEGKAGCSPQLAAVQIDRAGGSGSRHSAQIRVRRNPESSPGANRGAAAIRVGAAERF